MLYIIFFLFLFAGWQGIMNGHKSQQISSISLYLAFVLLLFGYLFKKIELSGVEFIFFVLINIFIFMQIYRISFYPKKFPQIIFVFLSYGTLIGYLLLFFNFSQYFIWFIMLTSGFLIINYQKQRQDSALASIMNSKDDDQKKFIDDTLKFNLLSSIMYLIAVIISFLYFYKILNINL